MNHIAFHISLLYYLNFISLFIYNLNPFPQTHQFQLHFRLLQYYNQNVLRSVSLWNSTTLEHTRAYTHIYTHTNVNHKMCRIQMGRILQSLFITVAIRCCGLVYCHGTCVPIGVQVLRLLYKCNARSFGAPNAIEWNGME